MKTKETIWSNIIKLGNCAISIFIMNDLETVAVTYLYSKSSVFSCCFESLKGSLQSGSRLRELKDSFLITKFTLSCRSVCVFIY